MLVAEQQRRVAQPSLADGAEAALAQSCDIEARDLGTHRRRDRPDMQVLEHLIDPYRGELHAPSRSGDLFSQEAIALRRYRRAVKPDKTRFRRAVDGA